ncbi:unnamed protein product [Protopolystoma xenopodis]|uniref:Uncharacterized protein n=1 Tax=Protopolystoma xenopodis TaxID=117903 RepID=A0A448XD07_9PLAT|nr:unnamed protein product [Protopolystoma xenopodis]
MKCIRKRLVGRSHRKKTANSSCSAAVWVYYHMQVDAIYEASAFVSGETGAAFVRDYNPSRDTYETRECQSQSGLDKDDTLRRSEARVTAESSLCLAALFLKILSVSVSGSGTRAFWPHALTEPNSISQTSMDSYSDDVCHSIDEGLAQFLRGRMTVIGGLVCTIRQSLLRDNPPSVSGETASRIHSSQFFLKNENRRIVFLLKADPPEFIIRFALLEGLAHKPTMHATLLGCLLVKTLHFSHRKQS